jgi:hypothetical protein
MYNVMLRRMTEAYGGMYRPHLQGRRESQDSSVWKLYVPPKLRHISSKLHVVVYKDDDRH